MIAKGENFFYKYFTNTVFLSILFVKKYEFNLSYTVF